MIVVEKSLILIVGGALIAAVMVHGLYLAWRNRASGLSVEERSAEDAAESANADFEDGILSPPRPSDVAPMQQESLTLAGSGLRPGLQEPEPAGNGDAAPVEAPRPAAQEAIVPDRTPRPGIRSTPHAGAIKPPSRQPTRPTSTGRRNGKALASAPKGTELFAINVLARNGGRFGGAELLEAFNRNGLKFREKNIFHRLDAKTDTVRFSVVNAVEPGSFDLAAMEDLQTPGVSLYFQLPGIDEPTDAFDDMLAVARDIGSALGGDLKDENLSVLTGQTISHFRERIAEFSRKQMSARTPDA